MGALRTAAWAVFHPVRAARRSLEVVRGIAAVLRAMAEADGAEPDLHPAPPLREPAARPPPPRRPAPPPPRVVRKTVAPAAVRRVVQRQKPAFVAKRGQKHR